MDWDEPLNKRDKGAISKLSNEAVILARLLLSGPF
jgi:hypothetical protein